MTRTRQHIVGLFVQHGATVPERAIPFGVDDRATARLLRRMRRHGAVAEAAPGRFWLDPVGLSRFRRTVRSRVATLLGLSGAAMAAAAAAAFAE